MRLPTDLKERLDQESRRNSRSLTAEVVARLRQSLDVGTPIETLSRQEYDELLDGQRRLIAIVDNAIINRKSAAKKSSK